MVKNEHWFEFVILGRVNTLQNHSHKIFSFNIDVCSCFNVIGFGHLKTWTKIQKIHVLQLNTLS